MGSGSDGVTRGGGIWERWGNERRWDLGGGGVTRGGEVWERWGNEGRRDLGAMG